MRKLWEMNEKWVRNWFKKSINEKLVHNVRDVNEKWVINEWMGNEKKMFEKWMRNEQEINE